MNKKKWIKLWRDELETVIQSCDVNKFREFYKKWQLRGFYEEPLPTNDKVIEIMMRKMIYHSQRSNKELKEAAEKWLLDRGCSTDLE